MTNDISSSLQGVFLDLRTFLSLSDETYENIGEHGTVSKVLALLSLYIILIILTLIALIGGNPYIPLSNDLDHPSFVLAFFLLAIASFLAQTTVQFLSFRLVGGKGDLVAHAYLNVIAATILLPLLLFSVLLRADLLLPIAGFIVLLISLNALAQIHQLSLFPVILAVGLTLLLAVPLFLSSLFLFSLLQLAYPYELYDWRFSLLMGAIPLVLVPVIAYLIRQERLARTAASPIPLLAPLSQLLRSPFSWLFLGVAIASLVAFYLLDRKYPSISTSNPPFLISFLPYYDSDLFFVSTREEEFISDSQIEIWSLAQNKQISTLDLDLHPARMRPGSDGITLIISDRQSPHGDAEIFDPATSQFSHGRFDYLDGYGIRNPYRNEVYFTPSFGGLRVDGRQQPITIFPEKRYYSVDFHPNNQVLFAVGDNFIDVLSVDSLEVITTLRIGGKLRDIAITPDGQTLYALDALWRRIRIVPSPIAYDGPGLASISRPELPTYPPCLTGIDRLHPVCIPEIELERIDTNVAILSFTLQPIEGDLLPPRPLLEDFVTIFIQNDESPSGDGYERIWNGVIAFSCEVQVGVKWQRCTSGEITIENAEDKLVSGREICFNVVSGHFCQLLP